MKHDLDMDQVPELEVCGQRVPRRSTKLLQIPTELSAEIIMTYECLSGYRNTSGYPKGNSALSFRAAPCRMMWEQLVSVLTQQYNLSKHEISSCERATTELMAVAC
ncbi:hypothetical protein LSH36_678g01035 [Paralvinella palmiformis]|uniref:Uncharacterized protein n=1 Tax=Paralvinella palmiformis TaxID=53620 RepID=A0AAD9J3T3_9ANNE|nr:hypothetical protein LSH36_678g01035 [Paralvinella palmiformis]